MFRIDATNPSDITMIGAPVGTGEGLHAAGCSLANPNILAGGEFPVSLAINKAGSAVCALNGGFVNGVKYDSLSFFGLTILKSKQTAASKLTKPLDLLPWPILIALSS